MVNVPGRSKGCSTCRRRKIKCDETIPECLQCIKNGLQCPSPRTGAFFVHTVPDQPSRSIVKHTRTQSQSQSISRGHRENHGLVLENSSMISILQPDRADIFDQLFVSHFIESFGFKAPAKNTRSPTWLDELAVFLTLPAPSLVKHSIRAGSMFFYGSLADDVSIMTEACKWYSRSLKGLQGLLSQTTTSFSGDVICAVVMLTHFENLAGTSTEAWFQHVQGAAIMLESNGTESCREGFLHQVFRHLRLLVFVASILKNEEHVFSSPQWTDSPFEIYPKGPFDRLVDILFSLLPCLKAADKLIKHQGGSLEPLKTGLRAQVSSLLLQLCHWWTQCTTMMNFGELNSEAWATSANNDSEFHALDPNHFPILHHSDMPTAALAALYDAANIIALRLLSLGCSDAKAQKPRNCVSIYEERIQRHARSIISAKDFIAAIPGPTSNRGSIMMGLPYQILRIWGPTAMDGTSLGCFTKPSELFSDVAVYILSNQMPKYSSQGNDEPSAEDSGARDSHIDPMKHIIAGASLTCT